MNTNKALKNHLFSNRILGLKVLRHHQGVTTIKYSRQAPYYLLKKYKTQETPYSDAAQHKFSTSAADDAIRAAAAVPILTVCIQEFTFRGALR